MHLYNGLKDNDLLVHITETVHPELASFYLDFPNDFTCWHLGKSLIRSSPLLTDHFHTVRILALHDGRTWGLLEMERGIANWAVKKWKKKNGHH